MRREQRTTRMIAVVATILTVAVIAFVGIASGAGAATSATPAAGVPIHTPFIDKMGDTMLLTTTARPILTEQDLPRLLTDNGTSPTLAAFDAAKPITPTLIHGMGTIGKSNPAASLVLPDGSTATGGCLHWNGPCNIQVAKAVNGQWVKTGVVIPRIENRQLLIVDYANLRWRGSRTDFNHSILEFDEATGMLIRSYGWNGP